MSIPQEFPDVTFLKALLPSKHPFTEPTERTKQSELMNALFAHSLKLQFNEQFLHRFGQGEVVILVGTSTAGKSSIIEAYKQKRPEVIEEGVDKTGRQMIIHQIRMQYPQELGLLEATLIPNNNIVILDAIFEPQIPQRFKEMIPVMEKVEAIAAAKRIQQGLKIDFNPDEQESLLLEDVFSHSYAGKQTIFDVLQIDGIYQQCINKHFHLPIRLALVYCPFHVLCERMISRNVKANDPNNPQPGEKRVGTFPLFQYADLFGPKKNDTDIVLETLHRDTVVADFKKKFKEEIENERTDPEKFAKWISTLREIHGSILSEDAVLQREEACYMSKLLNLLGFISEKVNTVEITPRKQIYHYLLDSSLLSPEESAEILNDGIRTLHLI
jgi:hypothetical protein